jgi:hypothetical protein
MLLTVIAILGIAGGGGQGAVPAADSGGSTNAAASLVAEDQTPTGRFMTATEVLPILGMTKGSWILVRDFDGQDLLYVTQILSWRCGLVQLEYAVNDAPLQVWPLPPCHADEAAPNAFKDTDGLPYVALPAGSVETVTIRVTYDDLGTDEARFNRQGMLLP